MKTLAQMVTEVEEFERAKGWYDQPVSFKERKALLHSEVSETLEAYRDWGFVDVTGSDLVVNPLKPEGVGSELADVLIRFLGDVRRTGIDPEELGYYSGGFGMRESFLENLDTLHNFISKIPELSDETSGYRRVYHFLLEICDEYGINLEAEYERKMAYNRTRSYRHGGKRA